MFHVSSFEPLLEGRTNESQEIAKSKKKKEKKKEKRERKDQSDRGDEGPLETHITLWTNEFYTNLLMYCRLNRHLIVKVSFSAASRFLERRHSTRIRTIILHEVLTSSKIYR